MKYIFLTAFVCLYSSLYAFQDNDSIAYSRTLDDVVVVAEKRDISIIDIPVAVSVLKSSDLPNKGSIDIRSLSGLIPNLYVLDNGLKLSTPLFVRGIGTPTTNPTVGLYVDGVPVFDKNTYIFDLYDIRQIELLRGPQGTLQGRNTIGGMINIITNYPTDEFKVSAKIGYGNYGNQNYNILVNLPFAKNFYNKFFFAYNRHDGFFTNKWTGKKSDENSGYTLRYQGRWLPGNNWDLKFGLNYYKTEEGGYGYYNPDSLRHEHFKVSYNSPSSYNRDLLQSYVNVKKSLKNMTLGFITSYSYYDDIQKNDQDYSDFNLYYNEKPSHQNLVTQEINLHSNSNEHFDWIVGAFGFYKDLKNRVNITYNEDKYNVRIEVAPNVWIPILANYIQDLYNNRTTTKGIAGYGQMTVKNILPGLSFTAGLRYDTERAEVDYTDTQVRASGNIDTAFNQSKTYREWLPKFSLMKKWNENINTYISVSKGYRAGGYNIVLNQQRNNIAYKSDHTWNYEIGFKYINPARNFNLNLAAFCIDWSDQQFFEMEMNASVIKNGGDATSKGIEMDMQWRIIPELTYNLAVGYTHAEFTDFSGVNPNSHQPFDYKNNKLPLVPDFTFNTGAVYHKEKPVQWLDYVSVSTNVTGIGERYFDNSNDEKLRQKPYFLWNASCEVGFMKNLSLELWNLNILNQHYFANMLKSPLSMIPNREDLKYLGQSGNPFTFGASISYRFDR
ncbi:MAG: TonB-dependent receptor [Culturomica sp.]|jgi:iron complex outermembrane receptor protein|nr:TonB-dependent receptor [Culturomica sp.]